MCPNYRSRLSWYTVDDVVENHSKRAAAHRERTVFEKLGLKCSCFPGPRCFLGLLRDAVDSAPPKKVWIFVEQGKTVGGIREVEIPACGECHIVGAM